jgi:hypothetical protein
MQNVTPNILLLSNDKNLCAKAMLHSIVTFSNFNGTAKDFLETLASEDVTAFFHLKTKQIPSINDEKMKVMMDPVHVKYSEVKETYQKINCEDILSLGNNFSLKEGVRYELTAVDDLMDIDDVEMGNAGIMTNTRDKYMQDFNIKAPKLVSKLKDVLVTFLRQSLVEFIQKRGAKYWNDRLFSNEELDLAEIVTMWKDIYERMNIHERLLNWSSLQRGCSDITRSARQGKAMFTKGDLLRFIGDIKPLLQCCSSTAEIADLNSINNILDALEQEIVQIC